MSQDLENSSLVGNQDSSQIGDNAFDREPIDEVLPELEKSDVDIQSKSKRIEQYPSILNSWSKTELEGFIKSIENEPIYKTYISQKITFDVLRDLPDTLRKLAQSEGQAETELIDRTLKTLESLIKDLITSAQRYIAVILEIASMQKNESRDRLEAEVFSSKDHARKLAHNALISNSVAYTRFCNKIIPEKLGIKVPIDRVFTAFDLDNRRKQAHWAYANVIGEHLQAAYMLAFDALEKRK